MTDFQKSLVAGIISYIVASLGKPLVVDYDFWIIFLVNLIRGGYFVLITYILIRVIKKIWDVK